MHGRRRIRHVLTGRVCRYRYVRFDRCPRSAISGAVTFGMRPNDRSVVHQKFGSFWWGYPSVTVTTRNFSRGIIRAVWYKRSVAIEILTGGTFYTIEKRKKIIVRSIEGIQTVHNRYLILINEITNQLCSIPESENTFVWWWHLFGRIQVNSDYHCLGPRNLGPECIVPKPEPWYIQHVWWEIITSGWVLE